MSRFELVITFSPIMIDSTLTSASLLTEFIRLQLIVAKLLELVQRLSNEENNIAKLGLSHFIQQGATTQQNSNFNENVIPLAQEKPLEPPLCTLVRKCIENKDSVVLCEEGVGGTYFVHDSNGQSVAVFKPTDEEPGAINNPKPPLEKVLLPHGGGACREVAAYLLDRNRAGVPETHMLQGVHHKRLSYKDGHVVPKTGSVQQFVPNMGNSSSMGSSRFTVEDVHNIGILDIRLLNMDRNEENMLVRKEADLYRLVPIDHTYILPDTLDDIYLGWMYWRQAKVPFSENTLEYISSINLEDDARILCNLGIQEQCITNMRLATILLKNGAAAGLTLFQIASMICRKKKSDKSDLEVLVAQAGVKINDDGPFELLVGELIEKRKIEM